jgi:hypothetical protein
MANEQHLSGVLDFLEPVVGPMLPHRREWRVRTDAGEQLLELIVRSRDAGEPLLDLILGDEGVSHLVWISEWLCLVSTADETETLDDWSFPDNRCWWRLEIQCNDSRNYYWTLVGPPQRGDHYFVVHFLHVVIAVASRVHKTAMTMGGSSPSFHRMVQNYNLGTIRALVLLPRTRRTVAFNFQLTPEAERAIAFNGSPVVELDVCLFAWSHLGGALSAAMRANQCPVRLVVHHIFAAPFDEFAPALAGTTRIQELTVHVQDGPNTAATFNAIGRNRSIRHLVAVQEGPISAGIVRAFWESVLNSPSIVRVDASGITGDRATLTGGSAHPWPPFENDRDFNEEERRECAELVAERIRTNPRITSLAGHFRALDLRIMEARVVPIIYLNRLRLVVATLPGGTVGDMARGRSVSALLESPRVRHHPEMLYFLLNATRDCLLASHDA